MKHTRFFFGLLALVVLVLVAIPGVSAESPSTTAPVCTADQSLADLPFGDPPLFLLPAPAPAKDGCSAAYCDLSCRAQNYDYGVCLGTECICRFYFP